jgi:putative membrane protein
MELFWRIAISSAFAHGTKPALFNEIATGPSLWIFEPHVLFLIIISALYWRGISAYAGSPVRSSQRISFFSGIVVLIIASLPPIDTVADRLFSMHMVQHMMITTVGIPLILLGAPFYVVSRGLPAKIKNKILVPILRVRSLRLLLNAFANPLVALLLYEGVIWFWHIPKFYDLALLNGSFHQAEHLCMALAALNLWRILIDAPPLRSRLHYGRRTLVLAVLMTLDMALSAGLTYSSKVWYAYAKLPLPSWWSSDRLQDQQLGGLIMWVPGSFIWLTALIIISVIWLNEEPEPIPIDVAPQGFRKTSGTGAAAGI